MARQMISTIIGKSVKKVAKLRGGGGALDGDNYWNIDDIATIFVDDFRNYYVAGAAADAVYRNYFMAIGSFCMEIEPSFSQMYTKCAGSINARKYCV
jgi:hypothetical protein